MSIGADNEVPHASIRELRTDFHSIKRKLDEFGHVIITDKWGVSYDLRTRAKSRVQKPGSPAIPDYYARLLKRQPKPIIKEQARQFWEYERGRC